MKTILCVVTCLLTTVSPGVAQRTAPEDSVARPLSLMAPLIGSWTAQGQGFSSTLTYEWLLRDRLMRVRNVLRTATGDQIAEYEGHYAWHPGRSTIVFWTIGGNGELHEGTAIWRENRLWHDASVSGGAIQAYRSVLDLADGVLRYLAKYGAPAADQDVLEGEPLIYQRNR